MALMQTYVFFFVFFHSFVSFFLTLEVINGERVIIDHAAAFAKRVETTKTKLLHKIITEHMEKSGHHFAENKDK